MMAILQIFVSMKMLLNPPWRSAPAMAALLMMAALPCSAQDNSRDRTFSPGFKFVETTGEQLFVNICQGCHMADARGAAGAATYPSLQNNKNLEASGYPMTIIVNGQKAMPPVGAMMSNEQVAAVVNYLRTHFGNDYRDAVTAEDVKTVRP